MNLSIDTSGTVKNVNIRKIGHEVDEKLAVDIKFGGVSLKLDTVAAILGTADFAGLSNAFWDEQGEQRFLGLDPVSSWASFSACTFKIKRMYFYNAEAKKFKIQFKSKKEMVCEFQVSIEDVSSSQVAEIAELMNDEVKFAIERAQRDMFGEAA